jgi:hypothetical protein
MIIEVVDISGKHLQSGIVRFKAGNVSVGKIAYAEALKLAGLDRASVSFLSGTWPNA